MRTAQPFLVAACFFLPPDSIAQTDLLVDQIVREVQKDRLAAHVQELQDFVTRYTYTDSNTEAQRWLYRFFEGLGLDVERHTISVGGQRKKSVIARIPGLVRPDEIVIISGHFDSTSEDPYNLAPGADDDASAIAGVLESATILSRYQFDRTIEFMCYNAEEQGRKGSAGIAGDYAAAGKDVIAVINADMIGYWPTDWQRDLDIAYEPVSEWLADHVVSAGRRYVGIPISKKPTGNCRDDHVSWTDEGFAAVTSMDCWEAHNGGNESTPHYHRTTDTIDTLNLDCMTQAVQVNLAALLELAGPLSLTADADTVSARNGGVITLSLSAGAIQGGRGYFVLGSLSGTDPGIPLEDGWILPLAWDQFTRFVMLYRNNENFIDFFGALDGDGRGTASFDVPPDVLVGYEGLLTFTFAYPLLSPLDFASNAIAIDVET